jgi:hypothetical protein
VNRLLAGGLWVCALACTSQPPCESNESQAAACGAIVAAIQGQCGANTTVSCAAVLSSCAPDGGAPDPSLSVCTPEVTRCAQAVAAAADCTAAQALATNPATCPLTCYLP